MSEENNIENSNEEKKFFDEFSKDFSDNNKEEMFEDTRRCMLTMYRSNIQTHAGYLIAVIIGSLAFISRYNFFLTNLQGDTYIFLGRVGFFGIIGIIVAFSIYTSMRISYWNTFSSAVLNTSIKDFIDLYIRYIREANKSRKKKIKLKIDFPFSSIIEAGAYQHLLDLREKENNKRFVNFGLKKPKNVILGSILIAVLIPLIFVSISYLF